MSTLIVVVVVILALVTAGSIAFIAWDLTSPKAQESLERSLGHGVDEHEQGYESHESPPDENGHSANGERH